MLTPETTADYNLAKNRLLRKLDITLLPMLTLVLLMSSVDKSAVGWLLMRLKILGLERDLGLKGLDFNIGISLFYVTYFGCQIPSNIVLTRIGPVWLAFLVISFGLVTISTAFISNFAGFLAARIMLGLTESGLIPGIAYVLSLYYPRSALITRISIFLPWGGSLGGAVGGFLASGLSSINSIGSVTSWRKIFLVEGIITIAIGILCVFFIPDHPKNSRLLTEDERALVLEGTAKNSNLSDALSQRSIHPRLILGSCTFHVSLCALGHLINTLSLQGLIVFLPTIVASPTVEAQLRTVPPHFVSGICAVGNAYMSYRVRQRGIFIAVAILVMIVGYGIFVGSDNSHIRYGACFLALAGSASSSPIFLSWAAENTAPETVRAMSIAIVSGAGAIGSLISVWAYLPSDAPKYRHAHSLGLAGTCINFVLAIVGILYINWENAKRERGERNNRLIGKSQMEIDELGSQHPEYRYQP
ncbi:MFS general substrate transporter [Hysterangium stoloniferum]|nr:MFS general substrate transporter [Hysterangium stoloniferum]